MVAKLDTVRDLFNSILRAIGKKLARYEKRDFVFHEYAVEAVDSMFWREL